MSARPAWLSLLLVGCAAGVENGAPEDAVGRAAAPIVYGTDDRVEAVDEADPVLRERALRSTVALVKHVEQWTFCDPSDSRWTAKTLGERENLCPSEPFRDQPVLASCSGTLIDRDLVITAQHCLPTDEACKGMRFVMGLDMEADGTLRKIPRSDVYSCRQRVVTPPDRDIAIIRLDRPVTGPFEPAPIAPAPFTVGEPLMVSGFPTGIPMKVATNCNILAYRELDDGYQANCDLLSGNSGSGFFNLRGELLGVYYQGGGDYKPSPDASCFIRLAVAEDGTLPGVPTPQLGVFSPAQHAVDLMCAAGTATPLCAKPAICGDGRCEDETPESCPADCSAPSCGDGTCDPGEDYRCAEDCGARDEVAECGAGGVGGGGGAPGGAGGRGGSGAGGSGIGGREPQSSSGCALASPCGVPVPSAHALVAALALARRRPRSRCSRPPAE